MCLDDWIFMSMKFFICCRKKRGLRTLPHELTSQSISVIHVYFVSVFHGWHWNLMLMFCCFTCESAVTEAELDRLKQALKILSAAEKQLQHSNERSTWFTAALLHLGESQSLENIQSSINNNQSIRSSDGVISDMVYNSRFCKDR